MNKQKLSILGLSLMILVASCRKTDVEAPVSADTTQTTVNWKSVSSWQSGTEDNVTTYNGRIQDSSITADVVENGLVLVYLKSANTISGLPVQLKGTNEISWNYQVSENLIQVNADVNTGSFSQDVSFRYFVLDQQKLNALETQGKTRDGLMTLTYENAATLLK